MGRVRAQYSSSATNLSDHAMKAVKSRVTTEEHASKCTHGFHRAIEEGARVKTNLIIGKLMEWRNSKRYGYPLGKTHNHYVESGKSFQQIIKRAGTTNRVVNILS